MTAHLTAEDEPGLTVADQLVYHHPDRSWVFAATDENCRTL